MDPFTNISSHNAKAYPVSDACQYPPIAGVGSIKSKARESGLRWFGHVHRREQEGNLRQVMDMEVPGRRPRGRPRGRWRDLVNRDMRELRVVPEDANDRDFWRRRIRTADPSLG
ncbi:hypothetical protein ElyMa_003010000 [Elysia marginata]|uniref:Uncharacterized protein n=1 Tax=Elysia marginata TaxID=1093978 RepID=A0AAV4ICL7_9GAST|nr:hypothetical protein ElyMa_003010000 [Elysia marginata]